jgi:transposase
LTHPSANLADLEVGMITKEGCMEIAILRKQGKGVRAIARIMGVSRNTVRKYLRSPEPEPTYKERPKRPGKVDPYRRYLEERIKAAAPHRLPATVLCREIRAQGFTGSERLLRKVLSGLYPVATPEPLQRFETPPGQQMQVDWCVLRRGKDPLSAFVATLGHSRATFVKFVTSERFEVLRECHEEAFSFFGGVAHELLYDNMKTVVLERNAFGEGEHRFHPGLWDLAHHFGFQPRLCKPYRAKTKGKVERFNRYLRYSFYYPLQSRLKQAGLDLDAATANAEVLKWLHEVANCRVHGETGERPIDRLAAERDALLALPVRLAVVPHGQAKPPAASWPVTRLQRSPAVYEQLLQEGRL